MSSSHATNGEFAEELAAIIRGVRAHLEWLRDGGVWGIPIAPRHDPEDPETIGDLLAIQRAGSLEQLREILGECDRCKLCEGRTHIVFGQGPAKTRIAIVGEGPGVHEDFKAEAFVGASGAFLDKLLGALGITRPEVYYCNVVKCHPPENRTPEPEEIAACTPFLIRQLKLVQPAVIVTLGRTAADFLLNTSAGISRIRGNVYRWEGIPVVPMFHTAYLLRNAEAKPDAWEDWKLVRQILLDSSHATKEP